MKVITDEKKIDEVLARGVHEVFTKEELRKKLLSGKQLHFKLGTDVTGSFLHLGHSVIHRKLRDFQELGHKVTLIIGDFTTLVGDHSDKVDMREETTLKDVKKMEKSYQDQFFKTVIKSQTKVRHNSEWLKNLNFNDVIGLAKQFTLAQMLDRQSFMLRYKAGKEIGLDEFMYPLMQGYDSVALKCDVELGGTDQTFNLLAGRHIMPSFGIDPQCAVVMKLLLGSDGRPMGKSLKNFIPISSSNIEMYGQIMSIVDSVIFDYFELVTRAPMAEIEKMKQAVALGENPMTFKKKLAKEIVSFYHGEKKAKEAEENFINTFAKGGIPEDVLQVSVKDDMKLVDVLLSGKIVSSKTEFRRLVGEGAVTDMDKNEKIKDTEAKALKTVYKIGKHRFIKIK
ncbi:tyrosine--tRNA ligase [Candidatus Nomurabacteria bacterium]|nr:tyrosine--tRNA ligase [Candidatus Nomurabacteria bacterium]